MLVSPVKQKMHRKTHPNNHSNLNCEVARDLIDNPHLLNSEAKATLDAHISVCSSCKEAWQMEYLIRSVVVPVTLPRPSAGFESNLMAQLSLVPEAVPHSSILTKYGWLAFAATISALILVSWEVISAFVFRSACLSYAWFAAHFAGKSALPLESLIIPSLPEFSLPTLDAALIGNILTISIVLIPVAVGTFRMSNTD